MKIDTLPYGERWVLGTIAESWARSEATRDGLEPIDKEVFERLLREYSAYLLTAARNGELRVRGANGLPCDAENEIKRRRNIGAFVGYPTRGRNFEDACLLEVTMRDLSEWGAIRGIDFEISANATINVIQRAHTAPSVEINSCAEPDTASDDADAELAALFDPVSPSALEKMFPSNDSWKKWCKKAKEKGLDVARASRGKYNPYRAAIWWLDRQPSEGWDRARCMRTLARNLPARSRGSEDLLCVEVIE